MEARMNGNAQKHFKYSDRILEIMRALDYLYNHVNTGNSIIIKRLEEEKAVLEAA